MNMGQPVPAGPPPVPPAPNQKKKAGAGGKSNKTTIIAAAAGGAAVVGGGILVYYLFFSGGDPFPCPVQNLPEDTVQVIHMDEKSDMARRVNVAPGDLPDQAKWSYMAGTFCGGDDYFATLMNADLRGSSEYSAGTIAKAMDKKKETTKALECGKEMASSSKGELYTVAFGSKDKKKRVTIHLNGADARPEGTRMGKWKGKGALTEAACFLLGDKDTDCDDKSSVGIGRIEDTKMWLFGGLDDLQAFGEDYKEREKVSKDAEKLKELAGKVKRYKLTGVGTYDTVKFDFGDFVDADLSSERDPEDTKSEDSEKVAKDKEKQRKIIKDIEPWWAIGQSTKAGAGEIVVFYRAEKDDGAKDLLEVIEKLLKEERAKIKPTEKAEKKKDELEKEAKVDDKEGKIRKPKKSFKAYEKAIRSIGRKALEEPEVEQDGQWVIVRFKLEPDDDQKTTIEEFMAEQKDKLESASKVIDALLAGEKPEKDSFKTLGGSDFVDALDKAKENLSKKETP